MRRSFITAIALAGSLVLCATTIAAASSGAQPRAYRSNTAAFPVSVTSGDGTVGIAHRPARILSLSPSATEMLYAIGAGRQVVGVDKYSTYPSSAPRTSFTGYETSAEDYLPKHPDLVILAFSTGHLVAQLQKLHIPTLLLPPATTIAEATGQIAELGTATGHAAEAKRTTSGITTDLARVGHAAGTHGRGMTYYIEIDQTYYSATSKTFIGALFSRFKMVNIADAAHHTGSNYPQLSAEYVIKANPDYVFLADTVCCGQSAKTFAKRPGFATLKAVRLGHVIAVNDSVASEWGPHSMEGFVSVIEKTLTETSGAHGATSSGT
jgi:iron complex transport system substrate-binding protein